MAAKRILLIDDDVGMRAVLQDILEDEGYEVKTATDGRSALSSIENEDFDLILTDLKMPKMSGMEFLDYIEQNRPDLKVVVITAYTGKENVNKAKLLGAFEFLSKSIQIEELKRVVKEVLERNDKV
jgi:DNA-binding NtrC family response regulator